MQEIESETGKIINLFVNIAYLLCNCCSWCDKLVVVEESEFCQQDEVPCLQR